MRYTTCISYSRISSFNSAYHFFITPPNVSVLNQTVQYGTAHRSKVKVRTLQLNRKKNKKVEEPQIVNFYLNSADGLTIGITGTDEAVFAVVLSAIGVGESCCEK